MSTEERSHRLLGGWIRSLIIALPIMLVLLFAVLRWGRIFHNLIHVLMKLVVIA